MYMQGKIQKTHLTMLQDNIIKFFEESFRENRDAPAITDYFTGEVFTYYTMAREIARLHLLFDEFGLKGDDKVAILGRNNPRWVISYLATVTYGSVAVPIMQDFDANDINHILNHSGSKLLFLSDSFWDIVESDNAPKLKAAFSLSDFRCIYEREGDKLASFQRNILRHYNSRYPRGFSTGDILYEAPALKKAATICYTSGTTGFSKGAILTVGNLTSNVEFVLSTGLFGRGVRNLSLLPLGHIFGLILDMAAPLAAGTHITLMGKTPSIKVLLQALQGVHPHVVCMVPHLMEKIARREVLDRLNTGAARIATSIPGVNTLVEPAARKMLIHLFGGEIKQVIVGGAPLNREIEKFLVKIKFPFTVGYGMTECAPLISYSPATEFIPGSCGRTVARMEAKVESPDPEKIPGEILVRGDNVMEGYFRDKKDTARTIDRDEWLHTGDIGTISREGTVFLRGRMETRILLPDGGAVYPEETESILNVLPGVMESLVTLRDGKLVALVVPDYEQADEFGIGMAGIREMMKENLATLNAAIDGSERISEIILYPSEFEKTPKMSIRRYIYAK